MQEYYYNETLRRAVSTFGKLFDEMYVSRSGKNQQRVPIAYGPRQKFLSRVTERPNLPDDHVAITLPRMSFEMDAPVYAAQLQRNKNATMTCPPNVAGQGLAAKIWQPAPYLLPFELNIMTRNADEANQLLEQILPHFKPSVGLKIYPIKGNTDIIDDVNISLQTVSKEDSYEGEQADRRLIIYTIMFEMRLNLWGRVDTQIEVIKNAIINFKDPDTNSTSQTITSSVNPQSADETDPHTIDVTYTYGYDQ